jgi:pimeloyl-ACP methyl ester carboxylesterase
VLTRNVCFWIHAKRQLWRNLVFILSTLVFAKLAMAEKFQGMDVSVEGQGPAIVFIPGMNSNKETFVDTCGRLKLRYTCHLLSLPGFAGQAPMSSMESGFVAPMRDRVLAYIRAKKIEKPIIMGHSLGGFIAMMIAEKAPNVPSALILVDSFPYFPAILNPNVDAKAMLAMAKKTREQSLAQPLAEYRQANAQMVTRGMSTDSVRVRLLQDWVKITDRATSAQAMFDLMTIDLRKRVGSIKTPTLVLGAWAAYKDFGWTKASMESVFKAQYQAYAGAEIRMSDSAYHFIAWDDPSWTHQQTIQFLTSIAKR